MGHQIHDLDVIVLTGGLVLRGRATSTYAKQLAEQVAEHVSGLPVVANEIEVH
jgi:hypothetical protein